MPENDGSCPEVCTLYIPVFVPVRVRGDWAAYLLAVALLRYCAGGAVDVAALRVGGVAAQRNPAQNTIATHSDTNFFMGDTNLEMNKRESDNLYPTPILLTIEIVVF